MPYRTIAECDGCHKQVDTKTVKNIFLTDALYTIPNGWAEYIKSGTVNIFCSSECASKYLAKTEMTYEGN